ncbi:hypothetical protein OF83DRAFT_1162217 [Amylostereum chailletii]|nr:hypothetical protein OF83DRAFT_1162217 [Amylostereum chailletii]
MASDPIVTPETRVTENLIPPLNPALFKPSPFELAFLKAAISDDECEIRARVEDVQKDHKHPYPCIRAYHHVSLMMSMNKIYPRIVQAGKDNADAVLLDIGCCMGTDVRKLTSDGFPASQILACDLRSEFLALGHKLYADVATCSIHFFPADIFTIPISASASVIAEVSSEIAITQSTNIADLIGRVTFIYTGALFHLWDESTQRALALRLARLLKRVPGAIIFGRHQGLPEAGLIDDHLKRTRYGHLTSSWTGLWQSVFEEVEGPEFAKAKSCLQSILLQRPRDFVEILA